MTITEIWPTPWPGSNSLARFNVKLTDDVKLCGLVLRKRRDGSLTSYPPRIRDNLAFHIAPEITAQITQAAAAALAERRDVGF